MLLAKVIGTVVASARTERIEGLRMLVLQPLDLDGKPKGNYVVAFDAVGAGEGEVVLYVTGSSARQTPATDNRPADATVFAIVDTWDAEGEVKYTKDASEPAREAVVRSSVVEALHVIHDQRAVPALLDAIREDTLTDVAIAALGAVGDERAASRLIAVLDELDAKSDRAANVLKVLRRIGTPEALNAVTEWERKHIKP